MYVEFRILIFHTVYTFSQSNVQCLHRSTLIFIVYLLAQSLTRSPLSKLETVLDCCCVCLSALVSITCAAKLFCVDRFHCCAMQLKLSN